MKLIDLDRLVNVLCELDEGENEAWTPMKFKDYLLDEQPIVDAVPAVHATWQNRHCSNCGWAMPTDSDEYELFEDDNHFCYHCGHKMD